MAPITLLMDCGNTRIKWATVSATGHMQVHPSVATEAFNQNDLLPYVQNIGTPLAAWIAYVGAPAGRQIIRDALLAHHITPHFITPEKHRYGITLYYKNPTQDYGADRYAAIVAAHAAWDSNILVLDCGTCLTTDLVTKAGEHVTGTITLGPEHLRKVLKNIVPNSATTLDTNIALEQGIEDSITGAALRAIDRAQQRYPELKIVLTGGNAPWLIEHLSLPNITWSPDLVLEGLQYISIR